MVSSTEDLYDYAKEYCADYHPMGSDVIYLTSEYYRATKFGLPQMPIRVQDITTGEIIGVVPFPGEE
jgi:hypothetical protein